MNITRKDAESSQLKIRKALHKLDSGDVKIEQELDLGAVATAIPFVLRIIDEILVFALKQMFNKDGTVRKRAKIWKVFSIAGFFVKIMLKIITRFK